MARKSSDIALLLGSRGRARGRSGGFGKSLRGLFDSWFGRSQWREDRRGLFGMVPGWLTAVLVLAAFAGGWLVGGRLQSPANGAGDALNAQGREQADREAEARGVEPTVLEIDDKPMSRQAFIVSFYPGLAAADARARAVTFSRWLQQQGLAKAKPYEFPGEKGKVWTVLVYFENEIEQRATRERLQALPAEVPDQSFVRLRAEIPDEQWPNQVPIR